MKSIPFDEEVVFDVPAYGRSEAHWECGFDDARVDWIRVENISMEQKTISGMIWITSIRVVLREQLPKGVVLQLHELDGSHGSRVVRDRLKLGERLTVGLENRNSWPVKLRVTFRGEGFTEQRKGIR